MASAAPGGAGSSIAYPQNPLNTSQGERGLSGNDFPNVVGLSFDYKFPDFVHSGFLSRLANGFDLYGIYRFNSGQVYTALPAPDFGFHHRRHKLLRRRLQCPNCRSGYLQIGQLQPQSAMNSVAYLNPYTGPVVNGAPTPGNPQYVVYNSDSATYDPNGNLITYNPGTPVDPSSTRWIIDNQAYAVSVNNPYPGSSRSPFRGQTYSELDATILKAIPITERVQIQLSMTAYNALNQMYLGTGDAAVNASAFHPNHLQYLRQRAFGNRVHLWKSLCSADGESGVLALRRLFEKRVRGTGGFFHSFVQNSFRHLFSTCTSSIRVAL